jgi:uncharacterized membrane protein
MPIWLVLYFVIRNQRLPKENIILGATLPPDAHNDPETQSICNSFAKWLNITMLLILPLTIIPFFVESAGLAVLCQMTFFLGIMVVPFTVLGIYSNKLLAVKAANNWLIPKEAPTAADRKDTSASGQETISSWQETSPSTEAAILPALEISRLWFLLPVLASFIPVVHALLTSSQDGLSLRYIILSLVTAMFWLVWQYRFPPSAQDIYEGFSLPAEISRVRRYNWGKFSCLAAWSTCALNLLLWLYAGSIFACLLGFLGYAMIILIAVSLTALSIKLAKLQLKARDPATELDEDDYWVVGGLFYCNPSDKKSLINNRTTDMNWTFNLAKPAGKVFIVIMTALFIGMPFIGIWVLCMS